IDHGGPNVLELEVEPGPHELTLANNRAAVVVNGVRDRLRVLLVTGEPHAGERVWRNILKSDPSVDLVHFTILRPPEKQDGTPIRELSLIAFPIRELFDVKLEDFDLIIFDRYSRRGIIPQSYIENVVRYVRNGGAFLEAAGASFGTPMSLFRTPLGEILPTEPTGNVEEKGFKPQLTELGRRHPVTEDLPGAGKPGETPGWGRWFRQVEARVHNGAAVMSGERNEPLLVLNRVGKGRVAQLLSSQMGMYRITDGNHNALAAAGPLNPVELADVRTTTEKLGPAAKATGGGVFWSSDGAIPEVRRVSAGRAASGHNWMGFRENGDYV